MPEAADLLNQLGNQDADTASQDLPGGPHCGDQVKVQGLVSAAGLRMVWLATSLAAERLSISGQGMTGGWLAPWGSRGAPVGPPGG